MKGFTSVDVQVSRIEEMLGPALPAKIFFRNIPRRNSRSTSTGWRPTSINLKRESSLPAIIHGYSAPIAT
jgi:hypothetical protein